ncbi:sodium-dependent lysophosphatidylcholine symporter 1-B-like [Branchiostoma floridae x Branchiostoma belcheri]
MATEETETVSVCEKLMYASATFSIDALVSITAMYGNVFLLEVAQLPPMQTSGIIFSSLMCMIMTAPVAGYLIDRTDTRWGKVKPWLWCTLPIQIVLYFMRWYVPVFPEAGLVSYYFLIWTSSEVVQCCYSVANKSKVMYMTTNSKERDSITAYRSAAQLFGLVVGVAYHGQIVAAYGQELHLECSTASNSTIQPAHLQKQREGYLISAGVAGCLLLVTTLASLLGTTERYSGAAEETTEKEPIFQSVLEILSHRPFRYLQCVDLFIWMAVFGIEANIALFVQYSLGLGYQVQNVLLLFMVSACVGVPVWHCLMTHWGKKSTLALAATLFLGFALSLMFLPGLLYAVLPLAAFGGSLFAPFVLIPWSMLPDVIDDYTLERGNSKESLFFGVFSFFSNTGKAVSQGLTAFALKLSDYKTGRCSQPESVSWALRVLISICPAAYSACGLIFLWLYPITEHGRLSTNRFLQKMRAKEVIPTKGSSKRKTDPGTPLLDR